MENLDNLLRNFDFETPTYGEHTRMTIMQRTWLKDAKKDFMERLGPFRQGVDYINDIYKLWDRLNQIFLKDNLIACGPGCGYCCRQLVCCTTLEMLLIKRYISSLERESRRHVLRSARREAETFYKQHGGAISKAKDWKDIGVYLKRAHLGKRCIYLNNKDKCSIYPVRPIECRYTRTKDRCGLGGEPKPIKMYFDQVASDLLWEEDMRINHIFMVVPLIGWPISGQFGDFFQKHKGA